MKTKNAGSCHTKGEDFMEPIKYMTSLLTFYLKGEIKSEQNFINFKVPNTILGLIPLGSKTEKFIIDQIASTSTNMKLKFGKLVIGIVAIILGISLLASKEEGVFFGFLILLILGINMILDAFEVDLVVTTTAGQQKPIDFYIFEKGKAELAAKQINAMISGRLNDTNTREQTDRVVEAIKNK